MFNGNVTAYLESLDLIPLFSMLALTGVGLSLYAMQVTSHMQENRNDPLWIQHATRIGMTVLTLTFLWMFMYAYNKPGWQPWPPAVLMVFALDFLLFLRAVTVVLAQRRRERESIYARDAMFGEGSFQHRRHRQVAN